MTQDDSAFEMTYLAKTKTEKIFGALLLESIDQAFSTLGQTVKLSIYFNLETKFALPKQDIPDRIEDFSSALEKIFGQASVPLEILIMKCLNEKIKGNYRWVGPKWLVPDLTLEKYLKIAKLSIENQRKIPISEMEVVLNEGESPKQETR
jgi:hypothetical protein